MKQRLLSRQEVLDGYDAVVTLYPYIPPLSAFRAWEYAAFQHYSLREPVLDLGCGDGRMFHLLWPGVKRVVGVDLEPNMVQLATESGAYESVHQVAADQLPMPDSSFASIFANSSIEHMDRLRAVLASAYRILECGGTFLLSVVTDKFVDWLLLPSLARLSGQGVLTRDLRAEYVGYHNLVNALSVRCWVDALEEAGFEVLEHVPYVPEMFGRMFLLLDQLWHVPHDESELGLAIHNHLLNYPSFPTSFRVVLDGIMQMERDWTTGAGAVFLARRPG